MSETRLTPARRAELARLCAAATPGPWKDSGRDIDQLTDAGKGYPLDVYPDSQTIAVSNWSEDGPNGVLTGADAAFIAAARTALPEALAEMDRLTARWEALKVNIDAPAVVCSFRGDAYEQALLDVVREMNRLEQEP